LTDRYTVELTRRADKALRKLDASLRVRIIAALSLLRDNPYPPTMKALSGHPGYLRVRVADYRIIYTVEDGRLLVLVLAVGHRSAIDRNLP